MKPGSGDKGRSGRYRKEHELKGLQAWPEGDIPESVRIPGGAVLWPALRDDGDTVSLCFLDSRNEAELIHKDGLARLARIHWNREIQDFRKSLHLGGQARVNAAYLGGASFLEEELWEKVILDIFCHETIRDQMLWSARLAKGGGELFPLAEEYRALISQVLETYGEVRSVLTDMAGKSHRPVFVKERLSEVEGLVPKGFISYYKPDTWKSIPRWLQAVVSRARKGTVDPGKDHKSAGIWEPLRNRLSEMIENLSPMAGDEKRRALDEAQIMIEELRVALFAAGEVRAAGKISESRMKKHLDKIERML